MAVGSVGDWVRQSPASASLPANTTAVSWRGSRTSRGFVCSYFLLSTSAWAAGSARLLPGCSHTSPTRAPSRPTCPHWGSPCLLQRSKKNSQTTLKSTFAQPAASSACLAAFTFLCWNLLCKGNCSQPGLNGGRGLEATRRQNAKQSAPGERLCVRVSVWVCMGGLYTAHLLRLSLYHIPVLTVGEQTSCLT